MSTGTEPRLGAGGARGAMNGSRGHARSGARAERYACVVSRDEDGRITAVTIDATDLEGRERVVALNGTRAGRVAAALHDILRGAGMGSRAWTASRPVHLDQVTGAQAELLLRAVKPLRRGDRIDAVAEGVAAMSREEASYWHARAGHAAGLRALRVLLGEGRRW